MISEPERLRTRKHFADCFGQGKNKREWERDRERKKGKNKTGTEEPNYLLLSYKYKTRKSLTVLYLYLKGTTHIDAHYKCKYARLQQKLISIVSPSSEPWLAWHSKKKRNKSIGIADIDPGLIRHRFPDWFQTTFFSVDRHNQDINI